MAAGWHLKEVIIESKSDGRRWLCECNDWLFKNEGTNVIRKVLKAIEIDPYKCIIYHFLILYIISPYKDLKLILNNFIFQKITIQ